jgi:pilus assembly protein Flp/PilA
VFHIAGAAPKNSALQGGAPMPHLISKFLKDEAGATSIEYALIAAGISLAIITAVQGLGSTLNGRYAAVNTSLK